MAMLKSITPKSVTPRGSRAASASVSEYLAGTAYRKPNQDRLLAMSRYLAFGSYGDQNRVVMHAHSDNIMCDDVRGWENEFIATKEAWGKLDGIPYFHFIISPAPEDKVGAVECLELAHEWVERCYPRSQWFCAIHDDNAQRITHAHIIVNSVLPETGRKINRRPRDISREAKVLNELCMRHGLTPMMDNEERKRLERAHGEEFSHLQPSARERSERAIVARGGRSYKKEIRDLVDDAARRAYSWEEFVAHLESGGIEVRNTRKGITYVMRDWAGRGARRMPASRLGQAYTREGIYDRLGVAFDAVLGVKVATWGRRPTVARRAHVLAAARVVVRPKKPRARHVSRDGSVVYQTLEEVLATRVAGNAKRRELEEVVAAARTLHEGHFSSRAELAMSIDDLAERVAIANGHIDELVAAQRRLVQVIDRVDDIRERKVALSRIESKKTWNPVERARRKELREGIERDESWVAVQLDEARGWAERTGVDGGLTPQLLAALMLEEIGAELPSLRAQALAEEADLKALVSAERVLASLDGMRRGLMSRPSNRGERMLHMAMTQKPTRRGMRLPQEQRDRLAHADWSRMTETIERDLEANRQIAMAEEELRREERRRRIEADEWLATHGLSPQETESTTLEGFQQRGEPHGIRRPQTRQDDKPQQ